MNLPPKISHIVVLTGAGISAESGIPTFRDSGGLWENYPIEEVATIQAYHRNPKKVLEFYNLRRSQLLEQDINPNPAHQSLAELEKSFQGRLTLITQNVDNLHEKGGSEKVLHMHGELMKIRCTTCESVFHTEGSIDLNSLCQTCEQKGCLRPHIVWFGEVPFYMEDIQQELAQCDLFVSIGTSGTVYPAAMFVQMAKQLGDAYTIEVNLDSTENNIYFDSKLKGKASEKVPELVQLILNRQT